jgi:F0F1-type ATP synthase assembly protein I
MPLDNQASKPLESSDEDLEKANQPLPSSGSPMAAPWVRLTGAGLELAVTTLALGAIGVAVDRWVQTTRPVFASIAGLIGFSLGMIRFIRLAISVSAAQRDADADGIAKAMHEEKQKTKRR